MSYTTLEVQIPFEQIGHVEKYIRDHYQLQDTKYTDKVTYVMTLTSDKLKECQLDITNFTKGVATFKLISTFEQYE